MSDDLARHRAFILKGIEGLPAVNRVPAFQRYRSEPARFYHPRYGKENRSHGVPNPIAHLLLSRAIADNYVALRRRARASKLTVSPPVFDWTGGRALLRHRIDILDESRIEIASRREVYVVSDLRAFFHSIYTHAIAWSIHGKAQAKQNRSTSLYGNMIDLLCRNAQDGQTIGLPVGPDTSRLIAEVVASAIDEDLQKRLLLKHRDASRYIDDYTVSTSHGHTAETLLATLRRSAADFELALNDEKSAIHLASSRSNVGWQEALRASIPRSPATKEALTRYFYELGRLCQAHPDLNIEKFGLQNARMAIVQTTDWKAVQPILLSAYRRNSSLIGTLVELCLLRQELRSDLDSSLLREFVENRIPVLAQVDRTGEVIWLLFLALKLGLQLSAVHLTPLFEIENSFVALLVTCLDHRGLVRGTIDHATWDRSMTRSGLRSPMWLYAYEAIGQGFVTRVADTFISTDDYFSLLHRKRVRFLAADQPLPSIKTTLRSLRTQNERLSRLREAILDDDEEELDTWEDEANDLVAQIEDEY